MIAAWISCYGSGSQRGQFCSLLGCEGTCGDSWTQFGCHRQERSCWRLVSGGQGSCKHPVLMHRTALATKPLFPKCQDYDPELWAGGPGCQESECESRFCLKCCVSLGKALLSLSLRSHLHKEDRERLLSGTLSVLVIRGSQDQEAWDSGPAFCTSDAYSPTPNPHPPATPEEWAISSPGSLPQSAISGTPAPPGTEKPLSADDITLQKCKWVVAIGAPGKGREERARGSECANRQQRQGPAPSRTQSQPWTSHLRSLDRILPALP